jgi:hypothetical protein
MRALLALTMAFAVSASAVETSAPEPTALAEGRAEFDALRFERAIALFARAIETSTTKEARAASFVWHGLAVAQLAGIDAARADFTLGLREDPDVRLPPHTPPRVRALFELVQREERARVVTTTTSAPPPPPSATPSPSPSTKTSAAPMRAGLFGGAAGLGAASVASVGAAVVLAVLTLEEQRKIEEAIDAAEAARVRDEYGAAANALYGAAAATALGGAALLGAALLVEE